MAGGGIGIECLGSHIGISVKVPQLLKRSAIGRVLIDQLAQHVFCAGKIAQQSQTHAAHILAHDRPLGAFRKAIKRFECGRDFPLLK